MFVRRTLKTLAALTALLGALAPSALADGVGVVAEGSDQVTILQQSGFDPDQGSGDAATQIAAALGVTPNYWSGTEAFNQANQFEEWVHVIVVPEGHSSLGTQVATAAQPVPTVSAPQPASGIPGHGVAGTDTLVVSVDGNTRYFTVSSGTDHGAYVQSEFQGRSVSWDSDEGAGTDSYTAYLSVH